jgi:hypothetical protein
MTIAGRFKVLSYFLVLKMLFLILYHLFYIELRGISVLYTYTFLFDILDSPPFGYLSSGDDNPITSSRRDENDMSSSLYRLEIVGIELLSLYGAESSISLQDFQDAEPDILVHSTSAIIERFNNRGINSSIALKALCKKKGLHAEEANLISVDSLGMDVRVFAGAQVQTHRFPFKTRVREISN